MNRPARYDVVPQPVSSAKIALIRVSRSFRRADGQVVAAISDLSLEIPEGRFTCLIGPSGCGKSTLLQLIAGLLPTTSGRVLVDGAPVTGPGPQRGVVFQKDSVFPWMRVIGNVEYGLKCRGVPRRERLEIARNYLQLVGLGHVERAWPKELSGGMLKRVAIATVFANDSEVLLLDEPFAALDYVTKRQLHDVLLRLWAEPGASPRRTVMFVTHDVDEALLLADRIVVIHGGRIVDDIAVPATRPRNADTLVDPRMVACKHLLLRHLVLEGSPSARNEAGP
jgi:NitT/TauT family transport system ATP-binding protein